MSAKTQNPRIVVEATTATISRLATEDVLQRRTAAAISFEATDGETTPKLCAAAASAVAARLIAEQITWPVSHEALVEGSQRLGVARADAVEAADQLRAEGSLPTGDGPIPDHQAVDVIGPRLAASPHLRIGRIRLASEQPPEPAPEPVIPEPHVNPTAEGGYPVLPEQNIHELAAAGVTHLPREETIIVGGYPVSADTPPRERARLEALNNGPHAAPATPTDTEEG